MLFLLCAEWYFVTSTGCAISTISDWDGWYLVLTLRLILMCLYKKHYSEQRRHINPGLDILISHVVNSRAPLNDHCTVCNDTNTEVKYIVGGSYEVPWWLVLPFCLKIVERWRDSMNGIPQLSKWMLIGVGDAQRYWGHWNYLRNQICFTFLHSEAVGTPKHSSCTLMPTVLIHHCSGRHTPIWAIWWN